MGISIGIACIVRDMIRIGNVDEILTSIPTLILVIVGGSIGGTLSVFVKKDMKKDKESSETIKDIDSIESLV